MGPSAQVTASYELQPLPGAMLGDPEDKSFRTSPRSTPLFVRKRAVCRCIANDVSVLLIADTFKETKYPLFRYEATKLPQPRQRVYVVRVRSF